MSIQTEITVRFAAPCCRCDRLIAVGERAWWRASRRKGRVTTPKPTLTCEACMAPPPAKTRFPFEATIVGATCSYRVLVFEDRLERVA